MTAFEKLKSHRVVVLAAAIVSGFVFLGQFSDTFKTFGILCKTPVDAVLDCIDSSRMCKDLSPEACSILKQRYKETSLCTRGCSSSRP